jgi:hypothetical protein
MMMMMMMMMCVEQLVERELARETEFIENLPQYNFVHHESHMTWARTRAAAVKPAYY